MATHRVVLDPIFQLRLWNIKGLDVLGDELLVWQWFHATDQLQLHDKLSVVQLHQGPPFVTAALGLRESLHENHSGGERCHFPEYVYALFTNWQIKFLQSHAEHLELL